MKIFYCAFPFFVVIFIANLFVNGEAKDNERSECLKRLLEGRLEVKQEFLSSVQDQNSPSAFEAENYLKCAILAPFPSSNLQCIHMAENVFRILGDYKVITINCTAPFPLTLDYDGFRPTEAVRIMYWREAGAEMDTFHPPFNISIKTTRFGMTIQIVSITALHESFQEFLKQPFVHNSQFLYPQGNSTDPIVYPRTGKFTARGIRNSPNENKQISIYLFLEEPLIEEKIAFIRNEHTVHAEITESKLIVPCRLSHIVPSKQVHLLVRQLNQTSRSNQEDENENESGWQNFTEFLRQNSEKLEKDFDINRASSYEPTAGFILASTKKIYQLLKSRSNSPLTTHFRCAVMTTNGSVFNLSPIFPPKPDGADLTPWFGMHTIKNLTQNSNALFVSVDYLLESGLSSARIVCSFPKNLGSGVKGMFTYGWHLNNMQELRFSREFVLPNFAHLSYWVQKGLVHGTDGFRIENERGRGVYFCTAGSFYNMMEFKVSSHDQKKYLYPPGKDWETMDFSNVANDRFIYMTVQSPHKEDVKLSRVEATIVDSGVSYVLCCIVGTALNKVPTFWFVTLRNGTRVKVLKDDKEEEGPFKSSCATLQFSIDVVQVSCWSALWQSDDWKYAATPLQVRDSFSVESKENRWDSILFVFLGTLVVLVIFLVAAITTVYLKSRKRAKVRKLTKKEMDMVFNGVDPVDQKDPTRFLGSEHEQRTLAPIYRLPYDRKYEVPRRLIQIDKKKVLGSGEFGTVYAGNLLSWKSGTELRKKVAVKTLKFYADTEYQLAFLFEIKILAYLGGHENVVGLLAACTSSISSGQAWAVLELCGHGDLKKYLRRHRQATLSLMNKSAGNSTYVQCLPTIASRFSECSTTELEGSNNCDVESEDDKILTLVNLLQFSIGIANGMKFLTEKKVIHADLAARNILLDDKLQVKISDFGLSSQLISDSEYVIKNECKLAWKWMSFEALETLKFSIQSDIWAFGVVLWEIFSLGDDPYGSRKCSPEFVQGLEDGLRLPPPPVDGPTSELYALMLQCWDADPRLRPPFHDIHRQLGHMLENFPETTSRNNIVRTNYVHLAVGFGGVKEKY